MIKKDIRICFIGDSFVNGTGDETALGWTGRLCAIANQEHSITYYNLGIRRETSTDILLRFKNEISSRLAEDYDSRIVISFGVNDTFLENEKVRVTEQESIDNFRKIIALVNMKYKIILVGPPPIDDREQNQRIKSLCDQFKYHADLLSVPYIDIYSLLIDDQDYIQEISKNDGAHPKSNGYRKIAKIISQSENWWF